MKLKQKNPKVARAKIYSSKIKKERQQDISEDLPYFDSGRDRRVSKSYHKNTLLKRRLDVGIPKGETLEDLQKWINNTGYKNKDKILAHLIDKNTFKRGDLIFNEKGIMGSLNPEKDPVARSDGYKFVHPEDGTIKEEQHNVYCDMLRDVIDSEIEKIEEYRY